jgi:hypothetical protein
LGRVPADAIVAGGQVISVQTIEIIRADVAIAGSRIAAVGELPRASRGPRTRMIDAEGMFVSPGLIDGHCECHTISTVPRFQPLPRRTQHADFPHCALLFASPQGLWDLSCRGDFRQRSANPVTLNSRRVSYSHCLLHRVQPKPFRFRARSMWRRTFFFTQSLMKLKHSLECPTAK